MGEIERLVADADDGTVDEEFLKHLHRGGELLEGGRLAEAREVLEKAYKLQPKNGKAQNLLGLTYFKLGVHDRAAEVYEALVRDNPVDPTLRVNLGLVYLKLNALQRATREFETAVDLAPDHKKAQNYLGLAYAQAADYARAKDCFVAAGSLTMAEKMERALKDPAKAPRMPAPEASAAPKAPPARPAPVVEAPPPRPAELEVEIEVEPAPEPEPGSEVPASAWGAAQAGEESVEVAPDEVVAPSVPSPAAPVVEPVPEPTPPAAAEPAAPAASLAAPRPTVSGEAPTGVLPLSELTRALAVPGSSSGPFEVLPELLVVRVQGELLARLEGLLSVSGSLQYVPEMKRFRGKATDKAFGDGERRMVRLSGAATLVLTSRGRVFLPVEMQDESAYFLEESVFGFEESVVFENGRVPSKIAPDLHLVHLRGKGRVLLSLPTPARTVAITPGAACALPMSVLVGWHGTLTPRIVGLPEERDGAAAIPAVELTGEGYAIVSAPRPPPSH